MINLITAALLILFAAFSRLMPHPMNFAPVTAIALFAGFYLNKRYAFIVPLAALVISDAFIGFYSGIWWVYGTFALIALIGLWAKSRTEHNGAGKKTAFVLGATLASSVIFFLITNFGVWTGGVLYEVSWNGLIQCYTMALPFFRNSLAGDLVYVGVMFGVYELVTKTVKTDALHQSKIKK